METKLNLIREIARRDSQEKINNLIYLLNEKNLAECYKELKKGKGTGIDGVSLSDYGKELEKNLKELVQRLKLWQYKPKPAKRVYIPKGKGKKRGLGIPTVEDKIIQKCVKEILEVIYEVDFLDSSYGFRPGRSCHQALDRVDKMIMKERVNYVIDADIQGFFDNVDHKKIKELLEIRISDKSLLRLIVRILKGGIMEEGIKKVASKGTPQGGVLSPMLANIYLHYVLDLWIENEIKENSKGYVGMVRYADDFIICVENKREAEEILKCLRKRLEAYGLELSEEKTKIVRIGRYSGRGNGKTFNFLGFTHYNDRTRKGKYKLGRKTERKKFNKSIVELAMWLKKVRNLVKVKEWWKILIMKIRGYFQYYGISGNMKSLNIYIWKVERIVYKWINDRSQRKSYNWAEFREYLKQYPLPKPKIYHNLYTMYGK